MGLNLAEIITAAKTGYKPSDLIELSSLTDKYNKEDILSLVSTGYNLDDIKKTCELADKSKDDASNQENPQENKKTEENKRQKSADTSEKKPEDTGESIDYKKLYEEEKQLRESLQHNNASSDSSGNENKKTDEEIALDIASDIL